MIYKTILKYNGVNEKYGKFCNVVILYIFYTISISYIYHDKMNIYEIFTWDDKINSFTKCIAVPVVDMAMEVGR